MRVPRNPNSLADSNLRSTLSRFDLNVLSYPLGVETQINPERVAQAAGSARQLSHIIGTSSLLHHFESSSWLGRAYQHRSSAGLIGREVQAVVHAINELHVDMPERM